MVSYTKWYTKWYTTGSCLFPILFTVYMDGLPRESRFGIEDLFLGVVSYCDDFLLLSPTPEMVYKTYCNFVKSMLRRIIFPVQQIQIHPNPNPNVSILFVDVPKNRWRSSLIIRSCPGSVRLTILVISFMNQVLKK